MKFLPQKAKTGHTHKINASEAQQIKSAAVSDEESRAAVNRIIKVVYIIYAPSIHRLFQVAFSAPWPGEQRKLLFFNKKSLLLLREREGQRSLSLTPLGAQRSWNCLLLIHLMAGVNQVAFGAVRYKRHESKKGWALYNFSLRYFEFKTSTSASGWKRKGGEHLVALSRKKKTWSLTQVSFMHLTWRYSLDICRKN